MVLVAVNWIAVLIAAVVAMAIGAFWYSKSAFGTSWAKELGWSESEMAKRAKEAGGKSYALGFVAALVTAYIMAQFVSLAGATTIGSGVLVGFWVWLGFYATTQLGGILWEGKSQKYFTINVGYWLVNLLVMGGILAAF